MKELSTYTRTQILNSYKHLGDRKRMSHFMGFEWMGKKWIATTDGVSFVMIVDKGDIEIPEEETVNLRAILPELVTPNQIQAGRLQSIYQQVPMITRPIQTECDACDGEGEFEHWRETYDCKTCDGSGKINSSNTETIRDPDYYLKIREKHFKLDIWKRLMSTIQMVDPQVISILDQDSNNVISLFELDSEIVIGLAGVHTERAFSSKVLSLFEDTHV